MKSSIPFLFILALFLSACAPKASPTPAGPIVITDALNRSVTLPTAPTHIVITGKGLFMIADPREWTVIFSKDAAAWGSFFCTEVGMTRRGSKFCSRRARSPDASGRTPA